MGQSLELSEFLTARRASVTPADVGIPVHGRRQVQGLRREEVASLAGVSVEYYKRLERGQATSPSESVLGALADALRLTDVERSHLFDLARAAGPACPTAPPAPTRLRPIAQRVLDTIGSPVVVNNARGDYIGANALGRALFEPIFDSPEGANGARFVFLDPVAKTFWVDWEQIAKSTVGMLRSYAGSHPCEPALTSLVGELSTRSDAFRTWWAAHTVHAHQAGVKRVRHPLVGEVTVNYEMLTFAADELPMAVYTAEPGSASEEALNLLASWIATPTTPASRPRPVR